MQTFVDATTMFLICLSVIVAFQVIRCAVSLLLTAYRVRLTKWLAAEWYRRWKSEDVVREHMLEVLETGKEPEEGCH